VPLCEGDTGLIWPKFLLPDDFAPDGWSWDDDPALWDWPQFRDAAGKGKAQDTGGLAAREELRPFSGLIRWSDPTHRHLLHCTGSTQTAKDRYAWRREAHTESRRNTSGAPYRMASSDGETVCSWAVSEFHHVWADLALRLFSGLIATHPDATLIAERAAEYENQFATAAAVIAALSGPYVTGPAPKALRAALKSIGAASTRLQEVDAATVRLSVKVRLLTTDGVPVSATGHTTARRSRPNRKNTHQTGAQRSQAKAEAGQDRIPRRGRAKPPPGRGVYR